MEKRKRQILVIEDDKYSSEALEHLLNAEGYETRTASDAVSGYRSARRTPPDIVVVDLGLPDIDGRMLIKRFRRSSRLSAIPIIIITGENVKGSSAAEMGADSYLAKPVAFDALIQTISDLNRRIDARAADAGVR